MDIEKIKNDNGVKLITEDLNDINKNFSLVGGAVIDLLENKKPKDYDIEGILLPSYFEKLNNKGYKFICETKTAYTFIKNDFIIQFLKIKTNDFEYKISQSKYNLYKEKLDIHKESFEQKTLIPTKFNDKNIAKACLYRLPHYQNKGYEIHPMTYLSLLNVIFSKEIINS